MCGVFGVVNKSEYTSADLKSDVRSLFGLTEPRGRQATGLATHVGDQVHVFKVDETASLMLKSASFHRFLQKQTEGGQKPKALLGHCRLVTDGTEINPHNNQPLYDDLFVGVHNGVINNFRDLKEKYNLRWPGDTDTGIYLSLISHFYESGLSGRESVQKAFAEIEGAATLGLWLKGDPNLYIATNFGSLYYTVWGEQKLIFASEKKILEDYNKQKSHSSKVLHVEPGQALAVNMTSLSLIPFTLDEDVSSSTLKKDLQKNYQFSVKWGLPDPANMRRCKRCILPESYPFLTFDSDGVCSQCRKYENQTFKGKQALEQLLDKYRSKNGEVDCLVGLSGGRDSSFGLHVLKKEYGMNPIGFCYDWLLTSRKARHNISKMAAALEVEVIYRCGNYERQASNIRKNINGFLRDPDLGMMTFVQAGDKEMYHYGRKIRKEVGVDLTIWCSGFQLEQREFFIGYCGIDKTLRNNPRLYDYGWMTKLRLIAYYGLKSIKNPWYWNRSIIDNAMAFWHCFVAKDDFLYLFNYYPWDENQIEQTLNEVYQWEKDSDYGENQWRMDDFHTSFNNYVYYKVGGFSEFDDFRSNQVREGLITRDEAIKLAAQDNRTRYESLRQFADLVGFNLEHVIKKIDSIPKLYN